MISKETLRELIVQKLKDANVLIANRRYASAIYIAGYALELALKLKICKIFKFAQGFPENNAEFIGYQKSVKSKKPLTGAITKIKDIRNHDLNKLLFYSGVEYGIKLHYFTEWNLAVSWDPEMRYQLLKFYKLDAVKKVNAIEILIESIL